MSQSSLQPKPEPQSNLPQLKQQSWLHISYQEPMLKLAMVITALALLLAMVNAVPPTLHWNRFPATCLTT